MTRSKILMIAAVGVVSVVVIAGFLVYVYLFQPTDEQRMSDEYVEKIVVKQFNMFDERITSRLGPKSYAYVGPKVSDPLELISGPGLELGPPAEWRESGDDLFEPVGYGRISGFPKGMHCIVAIDRLRENVDPVGLYDIGKRDLREWRAGKLEILDITVPCQSTG